VNGFSDLIPTLTSNGGHAREVINETGHTVLYIAAERNSAPVTAALMEAGCDPWWAESTRGFMPLHIAAWKGSALAAQELLGNLPPVGVAGVSLIQATDSANNATALHWAVVAGELETATLLIEWGAQPNVRDAQGNMPLHLIRPALPKTWDRKDEFVRLLALHGARCGRGEGELFKNSKGELPLQGLPQDTLKIYEISRGDFKGKKEKLHVELPPLDDSRLKDSPSCLVCTQPFGVMHHKHHCRSCGVRVCNSCSGMSVMSGVKSSRVCDGCFNGLGALLGAHLNRNPRFNAQVARPRAQTQTPEPVSKQAEERNTTPPAPAVEQANRNADLEAMRAELSDIKAMREDLEDPSKAHAVRQTDRQRSASTKEKTAGIGNLMAETMEMSEKRREVGKQVEERTSQMAEDAKNFAAAARRARQEQDNQKINVFGFKF